MRMDGPSVRVVCLTVLDPPLIGTGPISKYLPSNGTWWITGLSMVIRR